MSDTPRTDKEAIGFARLLVDHETFNVTEIIPADFSRQLERELEQANARLERYDKRSESGESLGDYLDCLEELEQARAEFLEARNTIFWQLKDVEISGNLYKSAEAKNASLVAQVAVMKEAMQLFIDRCDLGGIRSVNTYKQFKDILASLPAEAEKLIQFIAVSEKLARFIEQHQNLYVPQEFENMLLASYRNLRGEKTSSQQTAGYKAMLKAAKEGK